MGAEKRKNSACTLLFIVHQGWCRRLRSLNTDWPLNTDHAELQKRAILLISMWINWFGFLGKYSCLSAEFGLERLSWPAFKACYFPLAALVALSWTAFWIPIGSGRFAGSMVRSVIGCALGISVQMVSLYGYGSPNPDVAYSIAIDEWKVQYAPQTCLL